MLRGALHLHTTLSHDGIMSLAELSDFLKELGYNFIAITEHSYDLNQDSINKLVEEARKLSGDNFLIIPGIEFRCRDKIDILGYGTTATCDSEDPKKIIEHIKSHGGVAVWAHPTIKNYPVSDDWIIKLDGYEVWNNSNDGKYLPQRKPLRIYRKYRSLNPELKAFTGLDLHSKRSFGPIATLIDLPKPDVSTIIAAMRSGYFWTESQFFDTDSRANINALRRGGIYSARILLNIARVIKHQF
ncbi:MAG TPA: hypothetical protein DEO84_08260 [candidate division Zixibacteria bacterium]|jgi:hypothetical protein|nr:hypothetical protein [candidate division Zixibacteria bacterium]HBZ01294.1 hypothetical protein [candidate division Zixibacteria bacterium]